MKLPRSVLEKMAREGQEPPAPPTGGKARARLDEQQRRRGLDRPPVADPQAPPDELTPESSGDDEASSS